MHFLASFRLRRPLLVCEEDGMPSTALREIALLKERYSFLSDFMAGFYSIYGILMAFNGFPWTL